MQIKYSEHLKTRLCLRGIYYALPEIIYERSAERYFDEQAGHFIAIIKVVLYNKEREVMIAYIVEEDCAKI
jgi:hypothetical protein